MNIQGIYDYVLLQLDIKLQLCTLKDNHYSTSSSVTVSTLQILVSVDSSTYSQLIVSYCFRFARSFMRIASSITSSTSLRCSCSSFSRSADTLVFCACGETDEN